MAVQSASLQSSEAGTCHPGNRNPDTAISPIHGD